MPARECEPLRVAHADEQRADQPGRVRHRDGVDVVQVELRLAQRCVDDRHDRRRCARDAISGTTPPKMRCTSCDRITSERMRTVVACALDDRGRRFVARRLDAED